MALKHILFNLTDELVHVICESSNAPAINQAMAQGRRDLGGAKRQFGPAQAASFSITKMLIRIDSGARDVKEVDQLKWTSLLDHIDDELADAFAQEVGFTMRKVHPEARPHYSDLDPNPKLNPQPCTKPEVAMIINPNLNWRW